MESSETPGIRPGVFVTTHWTMVLAAGAAASPESTVALSDLCETYWYPLYAYARRHGHSPAEAEDLTQEFFARLLARNYLDRADPERGKFRAFLLTAYKRFLASDFERQQAAKRGGGQRTVSLNVEDAEARLVLEPGHHWTPARAFDREWAITLLNRVLEQLRMDYSARGKIELFDRLKGVLSGEEPASYDQLAAETGMTAGALRVAVHRIRQRYGELLKQEIAHTVTDGQSLDDEYRWLLEAVRGE